MTENETPAAEAAPLEIPRDAAEALYAALGTMLGIPQDDDAAIDDDRRERYEAAIRDVLETDAYWGGEKAAADAAMRIADAEQASLAATLQRTVWRLEHVLDDRDRERRVVTVKMRENEQLRAQVEQLTTRLGEYADRGIANGQRADQTEAALIKARRRIGELAASLDQAHDANSDLFRGHAESVSQAGELQAAVDRVRALTSRWRYTSDRKNGPLTELLGALNGSQQADKPRCVECGSTAVTYRNYDDAPFCGPCANGDKPTPVKAERMRHEARRRNLSEALQLGNGAPWDAITERAAELAQAKVDLDQARAEGVALQHALVELAGHAGEDPATAACFRGIADRWKYNGVSRLAECADSILAALADAEVPHA